MLPVCIGSYTFNTPGVYTYDCSIGSHAALGMVATITVGTGGCTNAVASNYNDAADFDGSCLLNSPPFQTSNKDRSQDSSRTQW